MIFTGKNLQLVRDAVAGAVSDVQQQIGSCPDVIEYADDLDELEIEKAKYERLLARIDKAIEKEAP